MEIYNQGVFLFLNNLSHSVLLFDWFVIFCAQYLPYLIIVSAFLYIFFHRSWQRGSGEVLVIFTCALLAYVIASTIKHVYLYDRPFIFFTDIVPLISSDSPHGSFPSGHATFFMALAIAFMYYHPKLGKLYLLGALLIGLSRIIAGVHWPLDIVAGYLLGGAVAFSVHGVINKFGLYDHLESFYSKIKTLLPKAK